MNEKSEIFSSQKPHEVHLAQGSTSALAKKATPMEPQIRHTKINPEEAEEIISIADGVSVSNVSEALGLAPDATSEQPDGLPPVAEKDTEAHTASFDKSTLSESLELAPDTSSVQPDVLYQEAEKDIDPNTAQFVESTLPETLGLETDAAPEQPDVLYQETEEDIETHTAPIDENTVFEPLGLAPDATSELPEALQQAAQEDIDLNSAPPEPLEMLMSEVPLLDTEQDTSFSVPPMSEDIEEPDTLSAAEPTLETDNAPLEPVAPVFMEEMNFPARVVKLKMANEKIRIQIEALEKPLFASIVESAPAAKAKGKGETAKPSKGH